MKNRPKLIFTVVGLSLSLLGEQLETFGVFLP